MSTAFSLVVVERDERTRSDLVLALPLGGSATEYSDLDSFVAHQTADGSPVVAVFGPSFDDPAGLDAIADFVAFRSDVAAVLVTPQLTTDTLQRALRAGVRDVVDDAPGRGGSGLREAVARAGATLTLARVVRAGDEEPSQPGRVITVSSSKGGAGKSVVATNLAVALARRGDRPVVLVDADLQFGDVAVMLSVTPRSTILDAVEAIDHLDASALDDLLIAHPSGLRLLAAPIMPGDADAVGAQAIVKVLRLLRDAGVVVVVDTSAHFDDVILSILEESDDIVLVAGMDVPSVKNIRVALQTLRMLGTPMHKVRLVLNRVSSRIGLEVSEVEQMLGLHAHCQVPFDVVVARSVNVGVPVVVEAPRSAAARALEELATMFAPAAPRPARPSKWAKG